MGLGKLHHFSKFWNFHYVINLQAIAVHGSTLYLLMHYYKPEIVIFECPKFS